MSSSEITRAKMADATLIRESDLRVKVFGVARVAGDPMFDNYHGNGEARISKVIFAEDFSLLAQEWFSKGRTIERVVGIF